MVTHGRPTGRAVLEQGLYAWGFADGGDRTVALAPPRNIAQLRRSPHRFFGPTKIVELVGSQRGFRDRKELVELRGADDCCGEHCVCLPTMVDLVLEEMHEQAVASFGLYLRITIDPYNAAKELRRQRIADCDQAFVDSGLSTLQFSK